MKPLRLIQKQYVNQEIPEFVLNQINKIENNQLRFIKTTFLLLVFAFLFSTLTELKDAFQIDCIPGINKIGNPFNYA
jgi:hypothetical protein